MSSSRSSHADSTRIVRLHIITGIATELTHQVSSQAAEYKTKSRAAGAAYCHAWGRSYHPMNPISIRATYMPPPPVFFPLLFLFPLLLPLLLTDMYFRYRFVSVIASISVTITITLLYFRYRFRYRYLT
jgi:hypothetical protein